jgi:hypothetical protein
MDEQRRRVADVIVDMYNKGYRFRDVVRGLQDLGIPDLEVEQLGKKGAGVFQVWIMQDMGNPYGLEATT